MYGVKLCLAASGAFGMTTEEQIRLFRKIGFEGFFTGMAKPEAIRAYRKVADEEGMLYQSIHAPFTQMAHLWAGDEEGRAMANTLVAGLEECAENEIPVLVAHAFIGFKDHTPTQIGLSLLEPVVRAAEKYGVKIAFENTEGEEYLAAIMEHFAGHPYVGFCWDTGHELCYNLGKDMLALYGDRLFATHLNDNLGCRDYNGGITFLDDLHLLPFDGIADWKDITDRLKAHRFADPLTFELKVESHQGRHENDGYAAMPIERYLTEAYVRACRVGRLFLSKQTSR